MTKIVAINKSVQTVYFPLDHFAFKFKETKNKYKSTLLYIISLDGRPLMYFFITDSIDVARDMFDQFIKNDRNLLCFEEDV